LPYDFIKIKDIILLVLFGLLANADEWVEIEVFGEEHEEFLREYLELPNGIPSHDTIQRVMAVVLVERPHYGMSIKQRGRR